MSMYRLNITFVVEPHVHEKWLELVRGKFIPMIRKRGYADVAFSRVLSVDPAPHFTYSLLVGFPTMEGYKELTGEVWDEYTAVADPLFGVAVLWFTSLLKEVEND